MKIKHYDFSSHMAVSLGLFMCVSLCLQYIIEPIKWNNISFSFERRKSCEKWLALTCLMSSIYTFHSFVATNNWTVFFFIFDFPNLSIWSCFFWFIFLWCKCCAVAGNLLLSAKHYCCNFPNICEYRFVQWMVSRSRYAHQSDSIHCTHKPNVDRWWRENRMPTMTTVYLWENRVREFLVGSFFLFALFIFIRFDIYRFLARFLVLFCHCFFRICSQFVCHT